MTCYYPLKAFHVGLNPDNGKNIIKVKGYEVDHLLKQNGKLFSQYESICNEKATCGKKVCRYDCESFLRSKNAHKKELIYEHDVIPCGQCLGCRVQRSREWANRMMLELATTEGKSWFVTLTYDDEHIPHGCRVDENGDLIEYRNYSLRKKDVQNFMKRLRNNYKTKIRYFCSGEYGDRTFRPHYHMIIFNLDLDESRFWPENFVDNKQFKYQVYRCPELEHIWKRGRVIVGHVNWNTCAYVGRYVTKKLTGKDGDAYEKLGIEPVFSIMSRNPGIGKSYLWDNQEKINTTYIIRLVDDGKQIKFNAPKYHSYLMKKKTEKMENENRNSRKARKKLRKQRKQLELLEQNKEIAKTKLKNELDLELMETDKDYLSYLETMKTNFEAITVPIMNRSRDYA